MSGRDVDDNSVPVVTYFDLRSSWKINDNVQIYGAIDDVLNTPPPAIVQSNAVNSFANPNTRADIYDALGRMFRGGIRLNFQ